MLTTTRVRVGLRVAGCWKGKAGKGREGLGAKQLGGMKEWRGVVMYSR
jgi:hypothetical protein